MNDQELMGHLGEQLFIKIFGGVQSSDKYDKIKDIVLDKRHIEVKTQSRHPTKPLLTISDVNLNSKREIVGVDNVIKCFNVDRLVFVEYDHTSVIKIWECLRPRPYERYVTAKGKRMIGFPVSQMILLHEHDDKELSLTMRTLSQSFQFK